MKVRLIRDSVTVNDSSVTLVSGSVYKIHSINEDGARDIWQVTNDNSTYHNVWIHDCEAFETGSQYLVTGSWKNL